MVRYLVMYVITKGVDLLGTVFWDIYFKFMAGSFFVVIEHFFNKANKIL